jgi:hypothetical protein
MPSPESQTVAERRAVMAVLADLHGTTRDADGMVLPVDLGLPERELLDRALGGGVVWPDHPYSERARNALEENAAHVERALTAYDRLAMLAHEARDTWVLTHGEPHWRNVLVDDDGLHLVDWDTARLAPAARDLWHVTSGAPLDEVERLLADYAAMTGHLVTPEELDGQALRWDLEEVALYVAGFSRPHADDDDSATAWGGLSESLSSLASRSSASAGPAVRSSTGAPR